MCKITNRILTKILLQYSNLHAHGATFATASFARSRALSQHPSPEFPLWGLIVPFVPFCCASSIAPIGPDEGGGAAIAVCCCICCCGACCCCGCIGCCIIWGGPWDVSTRTPSVVMLGICILMWNPHIYSIHNV